MSHFDYFKAAMAARGKAIKCTQQHAMYCLEVVPPVYAGSFFGVGEPHDHEPGGVTRHWILERTSECFCTFGTHAEAATAFAAV